MLFALLCKDKPDHLQVRLDTRSQHVAFLDDLNAKGQLKFAGPFLGDDGKPTGSLVMIETENLAAAMRIAEADPYAQAGLFESVDIKPWSWVFNKPK